MLGFNNVKYISTIYIYIYVFLVGEGQNYDRFRGPERNVPPNVIHNFDELPYRCRRVFLGVQSEDVGFRLQGGLRTSGSRFRLNLQGLGFRTW